jgi:hypothetical protein
MAEEKEQDQITGSDNDGSSMVQTKRNVFDEPFGSFLRKRALRWFVIFMVIEAVVVLFAFLSTGTVLWFLLTKLLAAPAFIVGHWFGSDEIQKWQYLYIALALSAVFYTAVFLVIDVLRFRIKKSDEAEEASVGHG